MNRSTEPLRQLHGWIRRAALDGALDECTLVVITARRSRALVTLMDRVASLPDQPREVVVVDGSGDHRTARALGDWSGERATVFDLVWLAAPPVVARQRNMGVDASTGPVVCFLDDDCLPRPGFFREIADVFSRDEDHCVGVVGGVVANDMCSDVSVGWRARFALGLVPRSTPGRYLPSGTWLPPEFAPAFIGSRHSDVVPSGAVAYRREVFARERFSHYFAADVRAADAEMMLRVGHTWQVVWCGDARADRRDDEDEPPLLADVSAPLDVRHRHLIWTRHTSERKLADRARFWGDVAMGVACDMGRAVVGPDRRDAIVHAVSSSRSAASCVVAPPKYVEPPARREYEVLVRERGAPMALAAW